MNEIDRWVEYMKAHPDTWKRVHTQFINAQFIKHRAFVKRLQATEEGRKNLKALYGRDFL
jgi:hypothetical protein